MKNGITGMLLVATIAAGGIGLSACSSDASNSGSSSVAEQANQAQEAVDNATQQGKEAVDKANQAVNDAKGAVESVQGGN